MSQKLFKGGQLITASEQAEADLLVEGETIRAIGKDLQTASAEIIDCRGKLILPGGVDPHVHLDLPMFGTVSSDDAYTGHKAAAFGGTTTVIDFVPLEDSGIKPSIDLWQAKSQPLAAVDYGFHMNITRWDAAIEAEMEKLLGWGISSVKVFMAYNGRLRLSDGEIFGVLRRAGNLGLLTLLHAENGDVIDALIADALAAGHNSAEWHARTRPAEGAVEAALRGASLAQSAGAPIYIVHMNTAGEAEMLRYAKAQGMPVYGETCPQYLFFEESDLAREDGAKWICSPPFRSQRDQAGLWAGLKAGVIDTIGTDHCPFFYDGTRAIDYEGFRIAIPGKELGAGDFTKIPNGVPGIGDRLPVLWTEGVVKGRISAQQFVAVTSANPARIMGLYPRKGSLLPGSDADIVVWDPQKSCTYGLAVAQHRTDYNLYEGWRLQGMPEQVFLRGERIVYRGEWLGRRGQGRFIPRKPQPGRIDAVWG